MRYRQKTPCLDCGTPAGGKRCRRCWFLSQPPKAPERTKTFAEKRRRAAFVAEYRKTWGDWCPGWRRPEHYVDHATNPITADHVTAVAAGGAEDGPLQALCRSCNSTKKDGRPRGRVTVRRTPPAEPSRRSRAWYVTPTRISTDTW